ncbi:penicillin-binding protein 2 [Candidatus Kuenenbacteria bacterium CG23_combo_of_CG06-09_8_20_14_all_36_9]|uniref:Penicillin-binding protein 2 n=1 Tax=Candidatus Kuenenbacteria bacterium CG10_big_fil_rev_8_21_14_0_10_36_11 TaxID=1974618 RepID=A0A2M6WAC6_9BACT|nr:MAG: penicillin-binding protein 2 [Candidatus Kuenenbacteria bacterium CG23_combo_of_CG06-09_8_20_14_all_36_9]PIT89704.1 MAG: penicillin-binding protein 2 [Candidatus Kuenenbacteria bacterium CG10_big_fil_rev_8_21_14_0_10_36_11]
MTNHFATPEDLLKTSKKYHAESNQAGGDGFFMDKKYTGSVSRLALAPKVRFSFLMIVLAVFLLWARVFYLQINKGVEFRGEAEGNRIRSEIVLGPRGLFYDRHRMPLTVNQPQFSLVLERNYLVQALRDKIFNRQELVQKIVLATGLQEKAVREKVVRFLDNENGPALDFELDYNKAMVFKAGSQESLDWQLEIRSERQYLDGYSLGHILGYLGRVDPVEWPQLKKNNYQFTDLIGQAGLEKQYEKELRGEPGRLDHEVNAKGEEIKILGQEPTVPGADLILTLDYELTKKISEILGQTIAQLNLNKAAAVVIDPSNGEILALVSLPAFDNNLFTKPALHNQALDALFSNKNQPMFNRVIAGEYPSGSTIKPMIAAAGLEEGLIAKNTKVLSVGGLRIDKWFFPDWKAGGHGITNVIKALAESVNTFFYYLGGGYEDFKGLGLEKIVSYAKLFGFGSALGIDLPGEQAGFLPTKEWKEQTKNEAWYIGDTYHLSIGQGDVLVTPLQIASMTATIANGGKVYEPHLVKEIFYSKINKKQIIEPKIIRSDFIKTENLDIVRQGMRQAVLNGSARALVDLNFSTAAKTGTAQVGGNNSPHAWLTVFAPYEAPEIALTVLIENGQEGSLTALPAAKEILAWYFGRK